MGAPPNHFTLVLGRIAHVRFGNQRRTLCGRDVGDHPTVPDMGAAEAQCRADCRVCKSIIRPAQPTAADTAAEMKAKLDKWEGKS